MPKKVATLDTPFRRNEKVLTTRELPGIAEGTHGKVKLINGLNSWIRYWVKFEDGRLLGQINQEDLVRLGQLESWHQREADRLIAADSDATAVEGTKDAAIADGDGGAASLLPAHILERSKAAKARLLG